MTPGAEWSVDAALVETLVRQQFPDWLAPVTEVGSGWDNAMFRLGTEWAVRLPRRQLAVALIEKEQRWLPVLGSRLTLPVPVPVRCGVPSEAFPRPWTIQPWITGQPADLTPALPDQAPVLAEFWKALHQPAPVDAPFNPFRGVPLADRAEAHQTRVRRLSDQGVTLDPVLAHLWDQAIEAPVDVEPTWVHGDLHPRNLLVEGGRLSGVLDWGDLTVGDRAVDLASAWMVFSTPEAQSTALAASGEVSSATLRRALGWALVFGVLFLEAGDPTTAALGRTILSRVAEFGAP